MRTPNRKALRARQRGWGLLEILAVLVIVAIAIGAAMMLFNKSKTNAAITQTMQEVQDITATLGQISMGGANTVTHTDMLTADLLPPSLVQTRAGARTIVNGFGGTVTIAWDAGLPMGGGYLVTYDRVPTQACVKLMTSTARVSGANLLSIAANGTQHDLTNTSADTGVSAVAATTECNAGNSNVLAYGIR